MKIIIPTLKRYYFNSKFSMWKSVMETNVITQSTSLHVYTSFILFFYIDEIKLLTFSNLVAFSI